MSRHSIDTIAEVLIDKINALEKNTNRIEKVVEDLKKSSVKIDSTEFQRLTAERKGQENAFLSQYEAIQAKNGTRLPNGLLWSLIGLFCFVLIFSVYTFSQLKEVDLLRAQIEYLQGKDTKKGK